MIHIAMILPTLDAIGGAERQVMLLATELAARGHRITVITLAGQPNTSTRELEASRVAWFSLDMRRAWIDPRGWHRYRTWAAEQRPDIIHTHLPHATWFARCIRPLAPVRVQIDTIHTSNAGSLLRRLTYRLTHPFTNSITCVSKAVAHSVEAAGLAPSQDLTTLPNGVAIPRLASPKYSSKSAVFHWLAVGRLAPVKDYSTLLRAFATLLGEPRLTIAGSGSQEQALHRLAAQLGIASRVHFAGFQPDIQPFLATADAFVLSSLWEGLPVSVLEAAAAGLPSVATNGAGTREAILPCETGILAPVGNARGLAAVMAEMMTMTPRQRQEMGTRARQFVEERYSLSAVTSQWEKLYARLLRRHNDPCWHG